MIKRMEYPGYFLMVWNSFDTRSRRHSGARPRIRPWQPRAYACEARDVDPSATTSSSSDLTPRAYRSRHRLDSASGPRGNDSSTDANRSRDVAQITRSGMMRRGRWCRRRALDEIPFSDVDRAEDDDSATLDMTLDKD